jgi:hypothetical protein
MKEINLRAHQFARIAELPQILGLIQVCRKNILPFTFTVLPPHSPGKAGTGVGSVSWDITSPSERSAPPGIEPWLHVEERDHDEKNYHKNVRVDQDAVLPETYEEKITGPGPFTDQRGGGTERNRDPHGRKECRS